MTMTLIQTSTLSSTGLFSFVSIPQTFTDLLLLVSARRSGTTDWGFIDFNSGAGGTYTGRMLSGNGTSAASENPGYLKVITGTDATSSTFSSLRIYIPNYSLTTNPKQFSTESVSENNATIAYQGLGAARYANTAAITSITIDSFGPLLVAGSSASLYGITKGSGGATVS